MPSSFIAGSFRWSVSSSIGSAPFFLLFFNDCFFLCLPSFFPILLDYDIRPGWLGKRGQLLLSQELGVDSKPGKNLGNDRTSLECLEAANLLLYHSTEEVKRAELPLGIGISHSMRLVLVWKESSMKKTQGINPHPQTPRKITLWKVYLNSEEKNTSR